MGAKRCSYPHPHDPGAFSNHAGASAFGNHSGPRAFDLYSPGCTDCSGNACNSGNAFYASVSGSDRSQPAF